MNTLRKIDLHCHSYYSDGECSPQTLLNIALANQVEVLALTDHDTLDGIDELQTLAIGHPITIIAGVECSVTWLRQELHVLGLNVNAKHPRLLHYLRLQTQRRWTRALAISDALCKLGVVNHLSAVIEIAGHYGLSRTHFAKFLVNNGYVSDNATAFKKYLGSSAPAYVPSQWAGLEETISVIKEAGGVAVIAHPMHYRLSTAQLKGLFKTFKSLGGEGVEMVSGIMNKKDMQRLIKLVRLFDFQVSTGSDFHRPQMYRATLGGQTALPLDCKPIGQDW